MVASANCQLAHVKIAAGGISVVKEYGSCEEHAVYSIKDFTSGIFWARKVSFSFVNLGRSPKEEQTVKK